VDFVQRINYQSPGRDLDIHPDPNTHAHSRNMAESSEVEVVLDPVKASMLLDLEQGRISQGPSGEAARPGIWIRGLDARFRTVWRGGRAIGIGAVEAIEDCLGQERVRAAYISFH
jgi:hypothetical protein